MRLHWCPNCRQRKMFETGAFWRCGACAFAVTETALCADEQREPDRRFGKGFAGSYKCVTELNGDDVSDVQCRGAGSIHQWTAARFRVRSQR
ncbi:hypothetical protein NITLEN_10047 [Nitrospira lenta]|uniref:Uncharacterized protein n=1 Tax=Nitrospira lenta TaxID=1436998 RepID=A0A330KZL0_9BACT|nr:hypothetical protein NITLEN_10047 [Nitrospira lenta]